MSAAPIARYLLELDADDDTRPTPASWLSAGKSSTAGKAAMIDEAYAKGFESGKAAAETQMAARLEEREAAHREELSSARETWAQLESGTLAQQLARGLQELETRLAETTARILKPFLGAELQRRAIADLVESLTALRAQEKVATITISGAADLLEALRAQLGGKVDNVDYRPSQSCDVHVTLGQTVLETRIGAWMARIEETMK
jgi:hypothetical protein